MRKFFIIIFSFLFLSVFSQQSINFEKATFKEILEKAKKENKLVFLDAYASWCGPCKLMEKNVFPDEKVRNYFNSNFINAHFDMEKGEGRDIAKKYQVYSYPTYLFLNGEGELAYKSFGYLEAEEFLNVAKQANKGDDKNLSLRERFEKGETDPEFLLNLFRIYINTEPDFAEKISERYFANKKDKDFSKEEVMMLIYQLKSADDPNYVVFKNNKEAISAYIDASMYDKLDVQYRLSQLFFQSVDPKTQLPDEIKYLQNAEKITDLSTAKESLAYFKMTYFQNQQKYEEFAKTAVEFYGEGDTADSKQLLQLAYIFSQKVENPMYLKRAQVWAEKSVMAGENVDNTYVLALLYHLNGDKAKSKMFAEQSFELGKNAGKDTLAVEKLLKELN